MRNVGHITDQIAERQHPLIQNARRGVAEVNVLEHTVERLCVALRGGTSEHAKNQKNNDVSFHNYFYVYN